MDMKITLATLVLLVSAGIYYQYNTGQSPLSLFENKHSIEREYTNEKYRLSNQAHIEENKDLPHNSQSEVRAKTSQELIKKLEVNLTERQAKSDEWQEIHNFTIPAENFFDTGHSPQKVLEIINAGIQETLTCINIDFCGAKPEPGTGYFDPNRTPAHITIIRLLDIKLKNFDQFNNQIATDDLLRTLKLNQSEIIERALQLLSKQLTEQDWREVLEVSRTWTGESSRVGMKYLSSYILRGENRRELINQARLKLQTAPPFTAISVLEGLNEAGTVDQREFEILAKSSCHFKDKARHNWLAIKRNLDLIAEKTHTGYELADICP